MLAVLACFGALADPNAAPQTPVDLELVLAVDVSFSIDRVEARQQREGYVAALAHPAVIAAIDSGELGRIAVTYVEWSEPGYQKQLTPWRVIEDAESAAIFAAELSNMPINRSYYTSISHALDYATMLIETNDYDGTRKVIDISGDGPQNQGRSVEAARQDALDRGVVINGLPILNDRPNPMGVGSPRDVAVDEYYERYVIGGPGAFLMPVADFDAFRSAILAKLVREIAFGPTPPAAGDADVGAAR